MICGMVKNKIIYFLFIFLISSCESMKKIEVQCVDAQTGQPLSGVKVSVNAGLDGDYTKSTASGETDSAGWYKTDLMIGCSAGCYDIYITYEKEGYDERKDLNEIEGVVKLHTSSWSD